MTTPVSVALIDDDPDVLDALAGYLESEQFSVRSFASPDAFISALQDGFTPDVIASDVRMPGMSGLELLHHARLHAGDVPFVLITGHGDIQMAVGAIKAGAHDFIEKPFDEVRLKESIEAALEQRKKAAFATGEMEAARARIAELSPRQREVMELAARGLSNKEIASELGISPRTVEDYRAWVMQRLGVKNLAELVRLVTLTSAGVMRP